MALKLGKCRLCLKLGDFYSIFTVDNNMQLAEMVMECARVKIYDGDGLPDKICSECIQKLSSAHIFKQQCERSDQELRRNYVPPPGFSPTPPPNRQSSDSAFSSLTETSKPSSSTENQATPVSRTRKRSRDSIEEASTSSYSNYKPGSSKRVDELRMSQKKPRISQTSDSDYEDNSASFYSGETDSDEPLQNKCSQCPKSFRSAKSLAMHMRLHKRQSNTQAVENQNEPTQSSNTEQSKKQNATPNASKKQNADEEMRDANDDDDKLNCDKCGKQFKLKIMLKRHYDICFKSPQKELLVSLEPIDALIQLPNKSGMGKIDCEMCSTKFKTIDNLEKHMRIVHAAVLKKERFSLTNDNGAECVPCVFCNQPFEDYYVHSAHLSSCPKKTDAASFECTVCKKVFVKKASYILHAKMHFFQIAFPKDPPEKPSIKPTASNGSGKESHQCRMCTKKLPTQDALINHLAAHMNKVEDEDAPDDAAFDDGADVAFDDGADVADDESRASTGGDSSDFTSSHVKSGPLKCRYCDKAFKYKKALTSHEDKHISGEIKIEKPEKKNRYRSDNESDESSDNEGGGDNTCDICEKQFSYKRLLIKHKRTKHCMTAGTKRAKINLKDCSVRCLICDIEMKVSAINEHNQTHIAANMKPRNLYTCKECGEQFKSCSGLANHIKLVHRLHQPSTKKIVVPSADVADFCEVVVTKAEPLDDVQSHNGYEVSVDATVNMSGFTCPVCTKTLPTLVSLKRHVNWHKNVGNNIEKKLECFVCKEMFRFQCHYKIHMRQHYNDTNIDPKLLTCAICGRKSKHLRAAQAHMNWHKQTRFKNKDYECSICKRVFQYRKVYLSHMAIHFKRGESASTAVVGSVDPLSLDRSKLDGAHTCHLCGKVCDSENSLKCHVTWHNSKTLLYGSRHECEICHVQFTNKRRLELHTRSHFEDENGPFKCHICGKGYIVEDYFKRHVKGHNFDHQSHKKRIEKLRKDKVKCPICERYYPDLIHLIRHLRRTHPESKMIKEDPDAPPPMYHSCKLCAKVFLDERRLQHHEEAHLRKPEFIKCKFCGKKTISIKNHRVHIKGHLTQKYIDEPLKCTIENCDETFGRGYDLHYHLRDAHGVNETWIAERGPRTPDGPLKELQCSICYKVLASRGNYERHIDYHNSLRCNYCFEYFTSSRFLEGHLAFSCEKKKLIGDTEIYPKKVKCHICYKAFHLQVKLDCHLRTQHDITTFKEASEGKKEIVCDYCFKVFENEYALSTHKIYHRTIGYYGCIYCNRKFNTMTLYRKHKNHHFSQLNVDNPNKCEHCDETFVAFREMIYHMRDVHGDDKEWIVLPKDDVEEKCGICHKTFFNLHRHMDYHEENRCKKCGEYFFSSLDYDNHLCAVDSEEEVTEANTNGVRTVYEECAFCFKPITKISSKKKHDMIHKGSGSISCRFCPLKFKTIDAFNIHAFSHRSRKYKKKPIKCRKCGEKFVKYGPFMRHMKDVHKSSKKLHYRATVMPEECVVCHEKFPNLHNHYRAHLQNQCHQCFKYFTSYKVFSMHQCDKEDSNPSKVFTCDANLIELINTYVPKDEKDDEKYYGYEEEEEEDEEVDIETVDQKVPLATTSMNKTDVPDQVSQDEDSQNSIDIDEANVHEMAHAPIISDVLSLFKKKEEMRNLDDGQNNSNDGVVVLTDDDSVGFEDNIMTVITIDDDD